ncbi:hypothetical protein D3C72_1693100 [compost metagenome]
MSIPTTASMRPSSISGNVRVVIRVFWPDASSKYGSSRQGLSACLGQLNQLLKGLPSSMGVASLIIPSATARVLSLPSRWAQ